MGGIISAEAIGFARKPRAPKQTVYTTAFGSAVLGASEDILTSTNFQRFKGRTDLILTSPPFPLNRKKKYGNFSDDEYLDWLANQALLLREFLSPSGSIVLELGNSWNKGSPTMSTLALKAMLAFLERGGLKLCQQFVWFNPAKLPTPAPWVTIERIRVKDAFTHIWWMSHVDRPKANNKNVLGAYSKQMKRLLETKRYNSGSRPSQHEIGEKSFLQDNGGSIPSNVLASSNTDSNSGYLIYCRANNIEPHPARMPKDIPEFFIRMLTDKRDLVLDPYCGSNTTGQTAEELERYWLGIDAQKDYLDGSVGRFDKVKRLME